MSRLRFPLCAAVLAVYAIASTASATVMIDWVTVGDPGNACDTQVDGCFGAVADAYRISKFETTNAHYAEFLNAKATSDPLGLYNWGSAGAPDALRSSHS